MGYHRAGFDVVGVDINPQPRYPFEFHQADALTFPLEGFDACHASPPCQAHSTIAKQQRGRFPDRFDHPDLVADTRARLVATGLPYVMENVQGAPLLNAITLCGSMFGLDVRRHRIFESNVAMLAPPCAHHRWTPRFRSVDKRRTQLASVVGVHGHVNYAGEGELRKRAMGIDWMNQEELAESIPPAYTEYLGKQLLAALENVA